MSVSLMVTAFLARALALTSVQVAASAGKPEILGKAFAIDTTVYMRKKNRAESCTHTQLTLKAARAA
jgi:hypothetical protein